MQRSAFSGPLLFTNGANGTPQNRMRSIPSNSNLPSLQQRPTVTSAATNTHPPARCACTVLFCACCGLLVLAQFYFVPTAEAVQVGEDFSAQLCMQKKRNTASNSTTTQQQEQQRTNALPTRSASPANPPVYLPLRRRHLLLLAAFLLVHRRPCHANLPRPLHRQELTSAQILSRAPTARN